MDIDKLTLVVGADIPVPAIRANIHQPTIREIAVIGEERFYKSLGLFNIDAQTVVKALSSGIPKNELERIELVKKTLESMSDFEILLQILKDDPSAQIELEIILMMVLPQYKFSIEERMILGLSKDGTISFDKESFSELKEAVKTIFCLNAIEQTDFNPQGDRAKAIADKLKKAREKVRTLNGENNEKNYILANYISSLGIGSNALNILNAVDLTVYQLFNQMQRFGLFVQHDYASRAALAGAKDVEQIDWLKPL